MISKYRAMATKRQAKPVISPEEMERRRKSVEIAIADSRIEGFPPPSRPEQDILDSYIRGEIEAGDLVDLVAAYVKRAAVAFAQPENKIKKTISGRSKGEIGC